jgi:hypothetical protein
VDFSAPVGTFLKSLGGSGFDTQAFLARVRKDGMAVSAAVEFPNYFTALDAIFHADLPLFFTSDALLHTVYLSYDKILIELETQLFAPRLKAALEASLKRAEEDWGGGNHVEDVRLLLRTALYLLEPGRPKEAIWYPRDQMPMPAPPPRDSGVKAVVEAIDAGRIQVMDLFGHKATVDFSQFKPRGHYTSTWPLTDYFRAMMWLSRADLAFEISPRKESRIPAKALTRQKKAALVLHDCVSGSGSLAAWKELDRWIDFMVGPGGRAGHGRDGGPGRGLGREGRPGLREPVR